MTPHACEEMVKLAEIRERVLVKDSDVELVALHKAAILRQDNEGLAGNDGARLRGRMASGARHLRRGAAAKTRHDSLRLAIAARLNE